MHTKLRTLPRWVVLFGFLWAVLSGFSGWYIGLPAVAGATAMAVCLDLPAPRAGVMIRLPRFLVFFLVSVWRGGWDVAWRALSPRRNWDPGWVVFTLSKAYSPDPGCNSLRLLMSAILGLMPGTLVSRFDADQFQVHVLNRHQDWETNARKLEMELARFLGMEAS